MPTNTPAIVIIPTTAAVPRVLADRLRIDAQLGRHFIFDVAEDVAADIPEDLEAVVPVAANVERLVPGVVAVTGR